MAVAPQGGVRVWGGSDPIGAAELVMRRFGLKTQLVGVTRPEEAILNARSPGAVSAAALDGANPWWARLVAERQVQAFDLLQSGGAPVLCLGSVELEPSGADMTLWTTDASLSAAAIEAQLSRIGFAAELLHAAAGLKLFGLAGYVQRHDARLAQAPGRLAGVVGVTPSPYHQT